MDIKLKMMSSRNCINLERNRKMKRFSKAIAILLITLSLVLLASCGKKDKGNNDNQGGFPGGNINTEGGLEGPIIPWD